MLIKSSNKFYVLIELICQGKYKKIKIKLKHKKSRSANIAKFV